MGNNNKRNMTIGSNNNKMVRTLITGSVLAITTGLLCWAWYKNSVASTQNKDQDDNKQNNKKNKESGKEKNTVIDTDNKKPSKCIIVTEQINNITNVNWEKLLKKDVVLLLSPDISKIHELNEDNVEKANLSKVIHCETGLGMWACVKSLRKDQLICMPSDLEDGIPDDIKHFVKQIIAVDSEESFKKASLDV
ncbi:ubiquitin-protein transferase activating protein PEX22 NDAI_0A08820 [Naumovozyma dairenensis CBS 421]|uniref:Peroxisome assembly protein 22 n=1 Tax=Naumovozyma dairenensis (strain ATCC 10597 / BCRC 20456 / CBS 421 / NBRC 0211 / NRRL Y-12639) TaxID=1071378 RepID=G0W5E6_NAUDC|nr:hypothetical protein NDAI_0A08820 [Naumovozyma dairenensis CBS 421]CCD23034.1 hypothetical protein NDAI_0A08820 [Naumovozyma dairenensis CBS 421]